MSTPHVTSNMQPLTGDLLIDLATTGFKWNLGPDRGIDWGISGGFNGESWVDPGAVVETVREALSYVSYYVDATFNFVGSFATPGAAAAGGAEINFTMDGSNQFFSSNNVWAMGFFPSGGSETRYPGAAGDIYLNLKSSANTLPSFEMGSQGGALLLHELGHALGLKHPHDNGGTGRPTYDGLGLGTYDKKWVSVMSYDDDYSWNQFGYHPATYMAVDVLALQHLYGKNMATNAGDSQFNLGLTNAYVTLWDASGNDTLSFSTAAKSFHVELPYLQLSNLVDTRLGVAAPVDEYDLDSPHTLFWLAGEYENVVGSAYNDEIFGNEGANTLSGGAGDDYIDGEHGKNQLRGGEGNDVLWGGDDFDDAHGNIGNDTVHGGGFDDWVVGGQGNDLLFGDEGGDLCYGQLGTDTVNGGAGADAVVGGQANDILNGGDGNDFVTGDRGDDTVTGGSGADTFHSNNVAGIDRVTDFSQAQGDRVLLDAGTPYTLSQVGADTFIDMGGGNQVILAGVQLSSLSNGWIVA